MINVVGNLWVAPVQFTGAYDTPKVDVVNGHAVHVWDRIVVDVSNGSKTVGLGHAELGDEFANPTGMHRSAVRF